MKKKNPPPGPANSRSHDNEKLLRELQKQMEGIDFEGLLSMMKAIHTSDQDEREKLKRKDLALIVHIDRLNRQVGRARPWVQEGLFEILKTIVMALAAIEFILWELKKLPGDPPFPPP